MRSFMRSFTRRIAIVVLVVSAVSRGAAADVGWEGQLALRWPNVHYDEGMSWGFGLGARGGVTLGRHLAVMLDYSDIGTSAPSGWMPGGASALGGSVANAPSSTSGMLVRYGAVARYSVRALVDKHALARAWILAGIGHELVAWDAGGRLSRPDLALGLGGSLGAIGARHFGDSYVEIQIWIAPRAHGGATTCGGPCDIATPPPPFDRSVVIDWGISFGR